MAPPANLGPSDSRSSPGRLMWRIFNVALPVAAGLATLIAVVVVVALFWWLSTLDSPRSAPADAPRAPRVASGAPAEAAPHAAASRVEAPSQPAPRAPQAAPAVPAAQPAAAPPRSSEYTGANSDAAKNRAIGEGLAHLGDNPELQRRLQQAR